MNISGLGDQYQILVTRDDLDRLAVKAEAAADRLNDSKLLRRIQDDLPTVLGIRADVELLELGDQPRSEVGKARRAVDLRPKQ